MDKYIEQLKPYLDKVSEKIGSGAQFGWDTVVRQQIAEGVVAVFIVLLGFVGLYFAFKLFKLWKKEDAEYKYGASEGVTAGTFLTFFFSILAIIFGSIYAILHFMNPHFYAMKFFLDLVAK